ncbi:MAG: LytR/AlgR family response regulator transcription factor [Draconibacterium sp.]
MNCLLLEKPHNGNQLQEFIQMIPYFNPVSYCASVFDAYEILQTRKIDVLFLDNELSKVSGIDFVNSLENKPMIVLFSSKPEVAVEAFNINAQDFLLKPVSFERFFRTANKVFENYSNKLRRHVSLTNPLDNPLQLNDSILVKADYQTIMVKLDQILYIEGLKDYIKIHTLQNNRPIITLNSLKKLQQNLPVERFSRVHKSYIVGLNHITAINKTQVMIRDKYIPIGESFKSFFMEKMEEMRV